MRTFSQRRTLLTTRCQRQVHWHLASSRAVRCLLLPAHCITISACRGSSVANSAGETSVAASAGAMCCAWAYHAASDSCINVLAWPALYSTFKLRLAVDVTACAEKTRSRCRHTQVLRQASTSPIPCSLCSTGKARQKASAFQGLLLYTVCVAPGQLAGQATPVM